MVGEGRLELPISLNGPSVYQTDALNQLSYSPVKAARIELA
jgi:hypothetical protein